MNILTAMSRPIGSQLDLRLLQTILTSTRRLSQGSNRASEQLCRSATAWSVCNAAISSRPTNLKLSGLQQSSRSFSSVSTKRVAAGSTDNTQSSSVNATEVSHFSDLASTWWDPQGSSRLLHLMNPLRHDFISECLSSESTSQAANKKDRTDKKYDYLDIGCGGGIFAESAARRSNTSQVIAIDPTPEVLAVAKEHSRTDPSLSSKLTYLNTSIEDLSLHLENTHMPSAFPQDHPSKPTHIPVSPRFDIITLFEVLEHVTSPSTFLSHCAAHLKPGGWLIVSTVSRTPLSFLITKAIAEMPVFGLVPPGTHTWSKYIKPTELQAWFLQQQQQQPEQQQPQSKEQQTKEAAQEEEENQDEAKDATVDAEPAWSSQPLIKGVAWVPGFGWQWVPGGYGLEGIGNYFFGIQKRS